MDLQEAVRNDLDAWKDNNIDMEPIVRQVVDQLESGRRRAEYTGAAGRIRWILDNVRHTLLTNYPSGANKVRQLTSSVCVD